MAKFCVNCGTKLDEGQEVCLKCGVKVSKEIVTNTKTSGEKSELAGFILGLVSSAVWFFPLFGYPVAICGIIFSANGLNKVKGKGRAIAGLILSIIFLVLTSVVAMAEFYDNILY